ncbi:MAG: hypothetical protein QM751_15565 [Paludibacteraceae bacterium]
MKNKLLLMLIIGSMGTAAYIFFNNLHKAKNEIYYSVTGENIQAESSRLIKKENTPKSSRTAKRSNVSAKSAASFNTGRLTDFETGTNYSAATTQYAGKSPIGRRAKDEIASINSDSPGMMLAQAVGTRGKAPQENTGAGGSMYYSDTDKGSQSGSLQKANNNNNDIIIDPGSDPDPDSQIPVGNGAYVFIALISLYSTYKWGRKK